MLAPSLLRFPIPESTVQVAQAAFPHGCLAMRMADTLGHLYQGPQFTECYAAIGRPAEDPVRLALVTILQFLEHLSDRQAADAVRGRIDWKYLCALDLCDPGFDASVLSEFRARLIAGNREHLLFETVLTYFQEQGLVTARGRQRTDSTHVLAAVRQMNRLERVIETVRATLNVLATVAPEWVRTHIPREWIARYDHRAERYRLPKAKTDQAVLAHEIGGDGRQILDWIATDEDHHWLAEVAMVKTLQRVWDEQYLCAEEGWRWRTEKELISSFEQVPSPYDPEARWATKGNIQWVGYKMHVTESCDDQTPHVITHVWTTTAAVSDDAAIPVIHQALHERGLTPQEHLVDTGYTDADNLATSQQHYGITLLGPVTRDPSWQEKAEQGFAKSDFVVDWEQQQVICPTGQRSATWRPYENSKQHAKGVLASFSTRQCRVCAVHDQCTKSSARMLLFPERSAYETMIARRREQTTTAFQERYRIRSGVESTHAQAIRRCDVRHARYRGEAKTRFQMYATATAINLIRYDAWLQEHPRAPTRQAHFARVLVA